MLAVPAGPYADTTGDGSVAYYAVAAVADGRVRRAAVRVGQGRRRFPAGAAW